LGDNSTSTTLHRAAALASQAKEVLLYCSCKQTTSCCTKRCKCFKSGAKCTNYCHGSNDEPEDCPNLAPAEERNTQRLVPQIPPVPCASTTDTGPARRTHSQVVLDSPDSGSGPAS
jgi:hypothetical protein